jgi:atlastin
VGSTEEADLHRESQEPATPTRPPIIPSWLLDEGDVILEGTEKREGEKGFHWRGGMEKCTQGIWIWSHPFVIRGEQRSDDIAVLLLDSQGAFDSQMTKEQSATIFGLTAVLSSLQIYNVSMQLQEDKIESLHYFMECAGSCMRYMSESSSADSVKLFQHLQFLVRDWPNFNTEWDLQQCEKQMNEHLVQHFDRARDKTTPDAIRHMFDRVSCWMLPHPGLKINKVGWEGRISDIDSEFIRFLDAYVDRTFGSDLHGRTILGRKLTSSTFVPVLETFIDAFKDLVPKSANLATAIAKSSNLICKEEAIQSYKSSLQGVLPRPGTGSPDLSVEEFARSEKRFRSTALDHFTKHSHFGPPEERDAVKKELVAELERLREYFEGENRRRMESSLTIFAGLTILVLVLYTIDKISDFTCDWYSETCVRVSNALFLIYFTIVVALLTNVYFLYQSRGHAIAVVAIIEMIKASVSLFLDYLGSVKNIASDWKESNRADLTADVQRLLSRIGADIKQGISAIRSSVTGVIGGSKVCDREKQ